MLGPPGASLYLFALAEIVPRVESQLAVWPGLARLRYLHSAGDQAEPMQPNLGDSPHWSPTVGVEGQFSLDTDERLGERLGPRARVVSPITSTDLPF
jgi:hypothetical protein